MQYFLGYSGFSSEHPFGPSLFVESRKRLGDDLLSEMNLWILGLAKQEQDKVSSDNKDHIDPDNDGPTHKGDLLMDATVSPQDIAYPTDLNLLNEARQISEKIIDFLHAPSQEKPRTYRQKARKDYLHVAQNRHSSRKAVRKAVGKQLRYLKRDIGHINGMLDKFETFSLPNKMQRQFLVVQTLYGQQLQMYEERKHSVKDRIVSIHQPHVRPIVRSKMGARVEFGSKLHLSLVDGFAFIDSISWDAFNEGTFLSEYVGTTKPGLAFTPKGRWGR